MENNSTNEIETEVSTTMATSTNLNDGTSSSTMAIPTESNNDLNESNGLFSPVDQEVHFYAYAHPLYSHQPVQELQPHQQQPPQQAVYYPQPHFLPSNVMPPPPPPSVSESASSPYQMDQSGPIPALAPIQLAPPQFNQPIYTYPTYFNIPPPPPPAQHYQHNLPPPPPPPLNPPHRGYGNKHGRSGNGSHHHKQSYSGPICSHQSYSHNYGYQNQNPFVLSHNPNQQAQPSRSGRSNNYHRWNYMNEGENYYPHHQHASHSHHRTTKNRPEYSNHYNSGSGGNGLLNHYRPSTSSANIGTGTSQLRRSNSIGQPMANQTSYGRQTYHGSNKPSGRSFGNSQQQQQQQQQSHYYQSHNRYQHQTKMNPNGQQSNNRSTFSSFMPNRSTPMHHCIHAPSSSANLYNLAKQQQQQQRSRCQAQPAQGSCIITTIDHKHGPPLPLLPTPTDKVLNDLEKIPFNTPVKSVSFITDQTNHEPHCPLYQHQHQHHPQHHHQLISSQTSPLLPTVPETISTSTVGPMESQYLSIPIPNNTANPNANGQSLIYTPISGYYQVSPQYQDPFGQQQQQQQQQQMEQTQSTTMALVTGNGSVVSAIPVTITPTITYYDEYITNEASYSNTTNTVTTATTNDWLSTVSSAIPVTANTITEQSIGRINKLPEVVEEDEEEQQQSPSQQQQSESNSKQSKSETNTNNKLIVPVIESMSKLKLSKKKSKKRG
ncbi:hypothetical protein RDWZM_010253 [Blomia tropicalis]|uniref:Uncharacterized protein n=1 Tax=Blomia tropicalis TaxID=40697 RepID=A0A9Q0RHI7_BLOTA|nr:hypothetical protein RDWZM_010253 [Blomia tropicalis]